MIGAKLNMEALRRYKDATMRQVKFAQALTLTRLAQETQKEAPNVIKQEFDTTRAWWLKSQPTGVKIEAAKTSNLRSNVFFGSKNTWITRQVEGKTRSGTSGDLVIPLYKKSGKSLNKKDGKWAGIQVDTWKKASGLSKMLNKYSSKNVSMLTRNLRRKKYPHVVMGKTKHNQMIYGLIRKKKEAPVWMFVTKPQAKAASDRFDEWYELADYIAKTRLNRIFRQALAQAVRPRGALPRAR